MFVFTSLAVARTGFVVIGVASAINIIDGFNGLSSMWVLMNNTAVLSVFLFMFMALYVLLYASIVRFKTPKWLVFR